MSKKIILCADGTWDSPHGSTGMQTDTNVRKLYMLLGDKPSQLKYYDSGVGTDGTPFEHFFGGAMGDGLFQKVQDGYGFLSYVWDPGDEIFVFGFSRGAYTARSLAGMIALFGVPTKNLDNQTVKRIFDVYRITDHDKREAAKVPLVEEYGLTEVDVRMVGVWDTVGALGIPGHLFTDFDQQKYGFLDTSLSHCIKNAFQAVSIDERRSQFKPTLWTNADGSQRDNDSQLEQVWFPGAHCDVGGSYSECQLSNITLRWMVDNAKSCGLQFDEEGLQQCFSPMPFNPLGPSHDEWKLIPWGPWKHRTVPANAVLANTVKIRFASMQPEYKPENLNTPLDAYKETEIVPAGEL
ncbi:DUF2235 domain-containing protein [Granulicella sibirica]|uniref:T6SS Phospholipase effector Tle1-like catalytic domain-containing protein n=1 Tax=Granulicella sibirica TaxID=2479048 RepID=A0A4Q0SXG7_9BACT|nr:DUF2235 domain-containing protein [Granulicella sibirica]RXH53861.1 hypothetical protein GRAN_5199 [Granulicella sibirica]